MLEYCSARRARLREVSKLLRRALWGRKYKNMKTYPDKKILFGLLSLAIIAGIIGPRIAFNGSSNGAQTASVIEAVMPAPVVPPSVTLGFAGDIMLDRSVRKSVIKNFAGDYSKLFEHTDFLKTPDIVFANLEGPVSDKGRNVGSIYSFRMDPAIVPVLKNSGIDVVSFANNHIGDWGGSAFNDSLKRLKEGGLLVCGAGINKAEASSPVIIEEDGVRIGFLCFSDVGPNGMRATETTPGILIASDPDFETIIANGAKDVNALVVSFHWGDEYKPLHNARQELLAKKAIDAGADFIAGHHPHVAQDIGEHNGAPIVYSLGNFIFDQYFSPETMDGLFVTATFDGTGIVDVRSHVTTYDKNSVVRIK